MVILLIGYSGCGKSYVAEKYCNKYTTDLFHIIDYSNYIRLISKEKGNSLGSDCVGNNKAIELLLKELEENTMVVGMRELDDVEKLIDQCRKKNYTFHLVYLYASEEVRFKRLMNKRAMSLEEVCKKDIVERQIGISKLIYSLPHHWLSTEQPIEDVIAELKIIVDTTRYKK